MRNGAEAAATANEAKHACLRSFLLSLSQAAATVKDSVPAPISIMRPAGMEDTEDLMTFPAALDGLIPADRHDQRKPASNAAVSASTRIFSS